MTILAASTAQRDLDAARQSTGWPGVGAAVPDRVRLREPRGAVTIGHFFDTIGRKKMITGTYLLSGLLLAVSAVLFNAGVLNAITQTIAWCVIFYFASAGASAVYLTVSEIFRWRFGRRRSETPSRVGRHGPTLIARRTSSAVVRPPVATMGTSNAGGNGGDQLVQRLVSRLLAGVERRAVATQRVTLDDDFMSALLRCDLGFIDGRHHCEGCDAGHVEATELARRRQTERKVHHLGPQVVDDLELGGPIIVAIVWFVERNAIALGLLSERRRVRLQPARPTRAGYPLRHV